MDILHVIYICIYIYIYIYKMYIGEDLVTMNFEKTLI